MKWPNHRDIYHKFMIIIHWTGNKWVIVTYIQQVLLVDRSSWFWQTIINHTHNSRLSITLCKSPSIRTYFDFLTGMSVVVTSQEAGRNGTRKDIGPAGQHLPADSPLNDTLTSTSHTYMFMNTIFHCGRALDLMNTIFPCGRALDPFRG